MNECPHSLIQAFAPHCLHAHSTQLGSHAARITGSIMPQQAAHKLNETSDAPRIRTQWCTARICAWPFGACLFAWPVFAAAVRETLSRHNNSTAGWEGAHSNKSKNAEQKWNNRDAQKAVTPRVLGWGRHPTAPLARWLELAAVSEAADRTQATHARVENRTDS